MNAFPENVAWLTVPEGVKVCVCPASADPVKGSAGTVTDAPLNAGTPAGQEIVSAGIVPKLPFSIGTDAGQEIVSAGTVPADPEKVSAGTVCVWLGCVCVLFETLLPLPVLTTIAVVAVAVIAVPPVVVVLFVPAGVKETVEFVGTDAGHAIVPVGVKLAVELVGTPAGHAIVPVGVIEVVPFVPAGVPPLVELVV